MIAGEKHTIDKLNGLGSRRVPFLFVIDFEKKTPWICPLDELEAEAVLFDANGISNCIPPPAGSKKLDFTVDAVDKTRYKKAFDVVQQHLRFGNSFLLNLTLPSRVETNFSLKEIFFQSKARYKLWFKNQFVVFSPEIFVQTKENTISSFPMKGTIDAALPDAEKQLLQSEKELAEHYTIVDLIRNDLSMVAKNVKVEKFRYIEHLKTQRKNLLQMSSKITGELEGNWQNRMGDILMKMLPAGSISGAPKKKTLEIIRQAEQYERGYYTGIFGVFDGENIDSGVMIRYIEKTDDGFTYKSGGGITAQSNWEEEYRELLDKIYVPV
ncbi:MAG: aminodeoxychorismate synthase component I [Bacteroidales bacterium]|nr:aminodeoxychorismate synthase component I [Bacteroidales bacterium]